MTLKKSFLACVFLIFISLGIWLLGRMAAPILQKTISTENLEGVAIAEPLWGAQGVTLLFVDTKKYPADNLAKRLAATGFITAVVDVRQVFARFNKGSEICLDHNFITTTITGLTKQFWGSLKDRVIVAGIADGALLPFVNAQFPTKDSTTNLSIGFSVNLPNNLVLCPPLSVQNEQQHIRLATPSEIKSNWRSVWTDQPADDTAVFIKSLGTVDTRIAAYDTPLDTVLIDELQMSPGQTGKAAPMPVVEVPSAKPSTTVTLFYSGDGGWRDLDRTVAGEMAALNYPVVGVDVLRYFWQRKSPEQAAADLAVTMAYYRQQWGVKSFVLAGYSFGADIMPAIYNRLPVQDQESVTLMVLIALANTADFEIHVSGWLGQSVGELPLAPELTKIPKAKILCIYGIEEKADSACTGLENSEANILELPGGHHFDQDYPKLTRQILNVYQQHGIN